MQRRTYNELAALLDLPVGSCPNLSLLRKAYPRVGTDTLISIFAQENQYKVIKNNHIHKQRVREYCVRYFGGEDILQLSTSVDFPPCMLLRRMLEAMLEVHKQNISEVFRRPQLLDEALHLPTLSKRLGLDDPSLAPSLSQQLGLPVACLSRAAAALRQQPEALVARLKQDVVTCVMADASYSPFSDVARQAAGLEFELYLNQRLKQAGISYFWTEGDLRSQGYHKTPDVRLQVPIAVRDRGRWRIVTWVDSKATFGDDRMHNKQMEEQYTTYVNRYGPGLVIYWFGFIEDLDSDPEVMVLDRFPGPSDIAVLPCAPASSAAAGITVTPKAAATTAVAPPVPTPALIPGPPVASAAIG